jgi:hypothetical protein
MDPKSVLIGAPFFKREQSRVVTRDAQGFRRSANLC